MAGRWVDVGEAARELGISTDAVRKRIARGSLASDRTNGSVLVRLDDSGTEAGREAEVEGDGALVEVLTEQVAYLRGVVATRDRELEQRAEEIRRRDAALEREQQLTAIFADRLRELEAPARSPEARESPASPGPTDTPTAGGGGAHAATEPPERAESRPGGERRSWWRRMFGP